MLTPDKFQRNYLTDPCHWKQGVIAWCELNEGDDNLVVAINSVMLPNKDNCIALKDILVICKNSQRAWQIISLKTILFWLIKQVKKPLNMLIFKTGQQNSTKLGILILEAINLYILYHLFFYSRSNFNIYWEYY